MSTTPKFCVECGSSLLPGAKFCPQCGAKVPVAAQTAAVASAAPEAKPEPAKAAKSAPIEPAAKPAEGSGFVDPLAAVLAGSSDDDTDDQLGMPEAATEAPKRRVPVVALAFGSLGLVTAGIFAWVATNDEMSARFQCSVLKVQEKCETDEDRQFKIEQDEKREEMELMANHYGAFDLNFTPETDTVVVISQKRYEETRGDFVKRIRDGLEDKRAMKDKRVGAYTQGRSKDGQTVGGIGFSSTAACIKPDACLPPPAAVASAGAAAPPPSAAPQTVLPECATWAPRKDKKILLPMAIQNLPLLEKEQADGNGKRLSADDVKRIDELRKNPPRDADGNPILDASMKVRTEALSSWVYEIELAACGYKPRHVLFYEHPAPPDLDVKKLEKEGWTVRKFKRTPDGRFIVDNASFDLLPEPRTIRVRYIQVIKELHCLRLTPDFKGKSPQGQKDAEELIWEQKAFSKELRDIAMQNDSDPEFVAMREFEMKGYVCPKIEAQ